MTNINIAFCINDCYWDKVAVVMTSLLKNHPKKQFDFYIFSSDLSKIHLQKLNKLHLKYKDFKIHPIYMDKEIFSKLKLTIDYISIETYYRYLIADLLPSIDKILYLDADTIINDSLENLYETDLKQNYVAGVPDLWILKSDYQKKLGLSHYINAGVLLMNLKQMRKDHIGQKLLDTTLKMKDRIQYQDQDIINIVCHKKIKMLDSIYNFAIENIKSEKSKRKQACIIHYTGANKPWGTHKCRMATLWKRYHTFNQKVLNRKIKVGLLIDEFFGGAGTAYGGYGFLARKYIAKYIPDEDIQLDVLLGRGKKNLRATKFHEDNVLLYKLPKWHFASRCWLKKQNYDVYLSIELTTDWVLRHEPNPNKKLILWIQDPRPKSAWENIIGTMKSIQDPCFYNQAIYDTVHSLNTQKRVRFISQGNTLNPLAKELYHLSNDTNIQYLPNPIEINFNFQFDLSKKKKQIIFLGRLEAQKRAWLFCEIAKQMPEYEFYVLGQFFRYQEENKKMLAPYMNGDIPNLHFVGHVDGNKKKQLIQESRLLVSTSIWEGIPISWLEALSYGTLLVSDLEREDLVRRFGRFVGTVSGDGFQGVGKFIPAIKELMENDELYTQKAIKAIEYVRQTHNIQRFITDLKQIILEELK